MWFNSYFNIFLNGADGMSTKKLNKYKNNIAFQNIFARFVQDALERYKFEGLPETISERVLLEALLWYSGACFFEKNGNLLALPAVPTGDGFNIYGDAGEAWVFARNGQFNESVKLYIHGSDESAFLKKTNGIGTAGKYKGVFVWENKIHYPFINQVMMFAQAVADTYRTLDVCRKNIKNPFIVTAEETVVPTVRKFFKDRDENDEFIISSGIFDADKVQILPIQTNSESLSGAIQLIEWYENKYRELCGIENNGNMDKKGENLITAELDINDMATELSVDKCVDTIQECLDDVNKIFGTNITVRRKGEDYEKKNIQTAEDDDEPDAVSDTDNGRLADGNK